VHFLNFFKKIATFNCLNANIFRSTTPAWGGAAVEECSALGMMQLF